MAVNARRNSSNVNNVPTITIVDSADRKDRMASCCCCVPELVGVYAILSMHFFFGIFSAAASFLSLGYVTDIPDKAFLGVFGSLYTLIAIISALSVSAIKRENIDLTRRLSIAFWILTALMFILSVIIFILEVIFKSSAVNACKSEIEGGPTYVDCEQYVTDSLISEAIKFFIIESISIYFAFVIYRYTIRMNQSPLPFTVSVEGQKTPTYHVYTTRPPTANDWVPPPTYSVRPTNPLPDDFNPDSKQAPN